MFLLLWFLPFSFSASLVPPTQPKKNRYFFAPPFFSFFFFGERSPCLSSFSNSNVNPAFRGSMRSNSFVSPRINPPSLSQCTFEGFSSPPLIEDGFFFVAATFFRRRLPDSFFSGHFSPPHPTPTASYTRRMSSLLVDRLFSNSPFGRHGFFLPCRVRRCFSHHPPSKQILFRASLFPGRHPSSRRPSVPIREVRVPSQSPDPCSRFGGFSFFSLTVFFPPCAPWRASQFVFPFHIRGTNLFPSWPHGFYKGFFFFCCPAVFFSGVRQVAFV